MEIDEGSEGLCEEQQEIRRAENLLGQTEGRQPLVSKGSKLVAFHVQEFKYFYGQWGRKAEENKPFSSSQCNRFAIFVPVQSSLIAEVIITNTKKVT